MSDYENAPATKMLASHCACCARPLVDAVSVETGVGPDCRKTHGFASAQGEPDWDAVLRETDGIVAMAELLGPKFAPGMATSDVRGVVAAMEGAWRLGGLETRRVANLLVHRIACRQEGEDVLAMTNAVRALGFSKLADRIVARLASIRIERVGGRIVVRAPYSETSVAAFRAVPGRRFEKEGKDARNVFPESSAKAVLAALRACFPGATAHGPKGLFVLA